MLGYLSGSNDLSFTWDILGFPGSLGYFPAEASIYFNRTDVQKAINSPLTNWEECTETAVFINGIDNSPSSGMIVSPGVIERSKRTVIGYGVSCSSRFFNGFADIRWLWIWIHLEPCPPHDSKHYLKQNSGLRLKAF